MRRAVMPMLALILAGCAVVSVRTEGGAPRVSAYPLGIRVERGTSAAVSVSVSAVGIVSGCRVGAAGVARADCDLIDARLCSAAVVHAPIADPNLIERLAAAKGAHCPQLEGKP